MKNELEITKLWESYCADGGGMRNNPTGKYFLTQHEADAFSKEKHGGYSSESQKVSTITDGKGRFYLLKSVDPVSVHNSPQNQEDLAKESCFR